MLEILFTIGMLWVFGKLFIFGCKAAWSISKFIVTAVLLPLVLVAMVLGGLIYIALPLLVVLGIILILVTR